MATIQRTDAASTIPEDYAKGIIATATEKSAALSLMRHKTMTRKQQRMTVLSAFPIVGFVTGTDTDVGLKATTNMAWADKYLNAEPIAAIVPIAEDLLDDSEYDLWAEIKPALEESIAYTIDAAIFFGTSAPSTWPTAIGPAAVAASNVVVAGTGVDIVADLNNAMGAVEADGFRPSGWWMRVQEEAALRGLRDANRQLLFSPDGPGNTGVASESTAYMGRIWGKKAMSSTLNLAGFQTGSGLYRYITGDFSQAVIGIRSDMKYKVLTEATLYNSDGSVMFALPQQDMVALRVVMRLAWQVPNPITRMNSNSATRYPFAAVTQA